MFAPVGGGKPNTEPVLSVYEYTNNSFVCVCDLLSLCVRRQAGRERLLVMYLGEETLMSGLFNLYGIENYGMDYNRHVAVFTHVLTQSNAFIDF